MTTGETLATEYKNITGEIAKAHDDDYEMSGARRSSVIELEKDLFGQAHARHLPHSLADEMLRYKVGVPYHLWVDETLYSPRIRGKLSATEIVKNQLQLIERFYATLKRNKQTEDSKRKRETQKRNKPVSRTPRRKPIRKRSRRR